MTETPTIQIPANIIRAVMACTNEEFETDGRGYVQVDIDNEFECVLRSTQGHVLLRIDYNTDMIDTPEPGRYRARWHALRHALGECAPVNLEPIDADKHDPNIESMIQSVRVREPRIPRAIAFHDAVINRLKKSADHLAGEWDYYFILSMTDELSPVYVRMHYTGSGPPDNRVRSAEWCIMGMMFEGEPADPENWAGAEVAEENHQ